MDEQGGPVTVSQKKGVTLYESTLANGLTSKRGPLSEKRLIFHKEYAEPDVVQVTPSSQTAPSTFKPAPDEGYTLPLVVNHYDVPGKYHEYAEPLPPEPEYATPFLEQPTEPEGAAGRKNVCVVKVVPSSQSLAGQLASPGCPELPTQYDFPTQRPTGKRDSAAGDAGLPEGSVESGTVYMEPQGDWTLGPRNGRSATQPATSPQDPSCQLQDSGTLAHVYHEPL
ncbi:hypothetical protein lerEdw1_009490 [Lerista edwardsae]|nr:hypothetical protein lerEdw1_009490 [Lerista edwardsae]